MRQWEAALKFAAQTATNGALTEDHPCTIIIIPPLPLYSSSNRRGSSEYTNPLAIRAPGMFSQLVVFGVAALTLARAPPVAGLLTSTCSTVGSTANAETALLAGPLPPPAYKIVNAAENSTLFHTDEDGHVFVSHYDSLKYGSVCGRVWFNVSWLMVSYWYIEKLGDHIYKITNKFSGAPLYVHDKATLRCGYAKAFEPFFISQPDGDGHLQISSAYQNGVLTVAKPHEPASVVRLVPLDYGPPDQSWKMNLACEAV
ncbi:hypothetical protein K438DRAFT_1775367 [Mycena galopus ATCC 62051]|nr:hypothetical protein K438DRAFT_1775367 [Mycena galopus ATCC 62051]